VSKKIVKMGRPSRYTSEMATAICERLAQGEPLSHICRDSTVPDRATVLRWVADRVGDFHDRYTRAREIGFDAIADDALTIIDELPERTDRGTVDAGSVQRAKNRAELRLKLLAKWSPKRYGDRQDASSDASPLLPEVRSGVLIVPGVMDEAEWGKMMDNHATVNQGKIK
jgi:hypothetical protein